MSRKWREITRKLLSEKYQNWGKIQNGGEILNLNTYGCESFHRTLIIRHCLQPWQLINRFGIGASFYREIGYRVTIISFGFGLEFIRTVKVQKEIHINKPWNPFWKKIPTNTFLSNSHPYPSLTASYPLTPITPITPIILRKKSLLLPSFFPSSAPPFLYCLSFCLSECPSIRRISKFLRFFL